MTANSLRNSWATLNTLIFHISFFPPVLNVLFTINLNSRSRAGRPAIENLGRALSRMEEIIILYRLFIAVYIS